MKKVQSPKINYFVTKVRKRKQIDDDEKEEIISNKRNRIEFPEHMLNNILFNLHGKSLLRFKCLSKEWKSLISSYRFNRGYLQHNVNKYS